MSRFNRYQSNLTAKESRRELQRTRAEAIRSRDLYMMIATVCALEFGGGLLTITESMVHKIRPTMSVSVRRTPEGAIEIAVTDDLPTQEVDEAPALPELEIRSVVEEPGVTDAGDGEVLVGAGQAPEDLHAAAE